MAVERQSGVPGDLERILKDISIAQTMPPEAMLGFDTADDAAVWRIAPNIAGILTIDFLTPIVDEPYDFGRIAAANALSDVFAMGGVPNVALNVVAMDSTLPEYVPRDMLRGGLEKVIEAGAVIMGGHSIDDEEPKYGLCVFGTVAPDALVRNGGAKPGDTLYLTKPLGTGIASAGRKVGILDDAAFSPVVESMAELNRAAGEAMVAAGVHAATDVTGFGLAGTCTKCSLQARAPRASTGAACQHLRKPSISRANGAARRVRFPWKTLRSRFCTCPTIKWAKMPLPCYATRKRRRHALRHTVRSGRNFRRGVRGTLRPHARKNWPRDRGRIGAHSRSGIMFAYKNFVIYAAKENYGNRKEPQ